MRLVEKLIYRPKFRLKYDGNIRIEKKFGLVENVRFSNSGL